MSWLPVERGCCKNAEELITDKGVWHEQLY